MSKQTLLAMAGCLLVSACGGSGNDSATTDKGGGASNSAGSSSTAASGGATTGTSGGSGPAATGGSTTITAGGSSTTASGGTAGVLQGGAGGGAAQAGSGAEVVGAGGSSGSSGSSGANAGGAGGALQSNPALDAACTPTTAVFTNSDPTGGGMVFLEHVTDTQTFIKNAAHQVCTILYRQASEVPKIPTVTLVIESGPNMVADTGGATTRFYSEYIESFAKAHNAADTLYEYQGVIHHEFTHIYQNHNGGLGVIEGGADFVRYRSGYIPDSNRHKGGNWNDGYQTSAFFFVYLDDTYPDFFYELNLAEKQNPGDAIFMTLTGKDVSTLWTEYQASF